MAKTRAPKILATAQKKPGKVPPKFPKSVAGAVRAALDKKAIDVVVLDLRKADGFTDFFVICTGTNQRQVNAIADGVQDTLRTEFSERPHMAEGNDKSQWILLDYFNFVVHVFSRECRAFYELERLWGGAARSTNSPTRAPGRSREKRPGKRRKRRPKRPRRAHRRNACAVVRGVRPPARRAVSRLRLHRLLECGRPRTSSSMD